MLAVKVLTDVVWSQMNSRVVCRDSCRNQCRMQLHLTDKVISSSLLPLTCSSAAFLQISKHAKLQKKQVDDVLGGDEAWKHVQKTDGEL